MHTEILSKKQKELLPLIAEFSKQYYLVGGTAIALHIGHRTSIDFDLFTTKKLKRKQIKNKIIDKGFNVETVIYEAFDQMHLIINSVKLTFFQFPHKVKATHDFESIIKIPELLDLAAMKAYALGGRAKWKDYVDLYFIIKYHYNFEQISEKAIETFGTFFNTKLFKEQLSYFEDIDYTEPVTFFKESPFEDEIKHFLIEQSLTEF
ncbi:MAG: hypothetical protein DRJ10_09125 [Bacteroidetes bacterium]|nr:MAG: hypothetical protein DRJ10_09125 [Bacteroidota bacterium]